MTFAFANLDASTRGLMLDEFDCDVAADQLYMSPRLNTYGRVHWPFMLRATLASGVPDVLAKDLAATAVFNEFETAPEGGDGSIPPQPVPADAAVRMAEIEFNRFYARGAALNLGDPNAGLSISLPKAAQ